MTFHFSVQEQASPYSLQTDSSKSPKACGWAPSVVFYRHLMYHVDDDSEDLGEGEPLLTRSLALDLILLLDWLRLPFYSMCARHSILVFRRALPSIPATKITQARPARPWHFWGNQPNSPGRLRFIFPSTFPIIVVYFAWGMAPPCHHLPELFICFLPLKAKLKQARINSMSRQLCPWDNGGQWALQWQQ